MMARSCLAGVLLATMLSHCAAFLPTGFNPSLALRASKAASVCTMQAGSPQEISSRRDALAAMISTSVVAGVLAPSPAFAERSYNSMTNAVRSYSARIKSGISFYEVDIKAAIDKEDWAAVQEGLGEKGKAYRLAYVDTYSSGVVKEVVELKGILKIFATSITASDSEGATTQKLYQYLKKYAEFNEKIKEAAKAGDKTAALKAWKAGCFALRIFMDTVNANIPRSVGKVELPPAPADIADIPIPKVAADLVG